MNVNWELAEYHFADDPELMLNIVDNGALQLNAQQHVDQKLERDHIFPRKILADQGLGDLADHIGNNRLVVMPINRRKKASMPTNETDFDGRNDKQVKLLYQTAISNLNRETYEAFRNERAARKIEAVNNFLDLDQGEANEDAGVKRTTPFLSEGSVVIEPLDPIIQPPNAQISVATVVAMSGQEIGDADLSEQALRLDLEGLRKVY
jgi:hypothetical protein